MSYFPQPTFGRNFASYADFQDARIESLMQSNRALKFEADAYKVSCEAWHAIADSQTVRIRDLEAELAEVRGTMIKALCELAGER